MRRLKSTTTTKYCKLTPIDTEVRYDHEECGDNKGHLYVTRSSAFWRGYCHKCGLGFTNPANHTAILESGNSANWAQLRDNANAPSSTHGGSEGEFRLPQRDAFPEPEYKWLSRYITDNEICQYGIYYNLYMKRIILPVYHDQTLEGYQARSLESKPKYLTYKAPRLKQEGRPLVFRVPGTSRNRLSDTLVVVEDMLSAIRVGRLGYNVWAILGSPGKINLDLPYEHVIIWYDMDKRDSALRVVKRLNGFGHKAEFRYSQDDPKALTDDQIYGIL